MTHPYEYCEKCHGEGVDGDPYGFFDYSCVIACDMCEYYEAMDEICLALNAADEAYHS